MNKSNLAPSLKILIVFFLFLLLKSTQQTYASWLTVKKASAQTTTFTYLPVVLRPPAYDPPTADAPRVNAPFFDINVSAVRSAIFWFGQVTPSINYADVRVGYSATELIIRLNIIDRRLWFDGTPSPGELENWDAATLYLDLSGNQNDSPNSSSYRFVNQMNTQTSPNPAWSASYQGNGSGWTTIPVNFTGLSGWRGNAVNDTIDDHGWSLTYTIPFANLGLSGAPTDGTIWGMGLSLHDRDDNPGSPLADQHWPNNLQSNRPDTWGQLSFGWPSHTPPPGSPTGTTSIRHGINGVNMPDAAVGGHSTCGGAINYWTEWGELNWAGEAQVNVQNQWLDVSDWPCFSKLYLTIPIDDIPTNKIINSATLSLYHFGNSGGGQWGDPPDSYIQVLTTQENWIEGQITWNNAPYATENITMTMVPPLASFPGWPGVPRYFDVSKAVEAAYEGGQTTLRLVVYSADGPRHTGKYFYSADADPEGRPVLTIEWSDP